MINPETVVKMTGCASHDCRQEELKHGGELLSCCQLHEKHHGTQYTALMHSDELLCTVEIQIRFM